MFLPLQPLRSGPKGQDKIVSQNQKVPFMSNQLPEKMTILACFGKTTTY
jgi:hypothetical protein